MTSRSDDGRKIALEICPPLFYICPRFQRAGARDIPSVTRLIRSFTYYGKAGAIYFKTPRSQSHYFLVTATTKNGNYAKTYPANGPGWVGQGNDLMVQNLTSNASYRSSVVMVNSSGVYGTPVTVECRLRDAGGNVIGSMFPVTLSPFGFYSVNPFAAAGIPYPAYTYDNVWLHLTWTSGAGGFMVYGATANSASNDPACHLPAMYNH